jgi:type III secretory pathway component EscS
VYLFNLLYFFPQLQQIGVAFLLILLLIVLAIGVIHHWASNNFYLTRTQTLFVCFLAFLLGLAAFLVGWFGGENKYHD